MVTLAVAGIGLPLYPAFRMVRDKSRIQRQNEIFAPENVPTFHVDYKFLPQYGPNFKVGKVRSVDINDNDDLVGILKPQTGADRVTQCLNRDTRCLNRDTRCCLAPSTSQFSIPLCGRSSVIPFRTLWI